jgi:hypothetical protein
MQQLARMLSDEHCKVSPMQVAAQLVEEATARYFTPRFEPLALGRPLTWKYRGQVIPGNRLVTITMEITERGRDERNHYAVAGASLWVDGKRTPRPPTCREGGRKARPPANGLHYCRTNKIMTIRHIE